MKNVVMDGTGVYIPPNKVYNEELAQIIHGSAEKLAESRIVTVF